MGSKEAQVDFLFVKVQHGENAASIRQANSSGGTLSVSAGVRSSCVAGRSGNDKAEDSLSPGPKCVRGVTLHGRKGYHTDAEKSASSRPKSGRCVTLHGRTGYHIEVPLPLGQTRAAALDAWFKVAVRTLVGRITEADCTTSAIASAGACALYLSFSDFRPAMLVQATGHFGSFLDVSQPLPTHVGLYSLVSSLMFVGSIRGLNKHTTAQRGNFLGVLATALGVLSVLASPGFNGAHVRFLTTFALASAVGYSVASQVQMEEMPQLVAGFHSFVGLAAVFCGFAHFSGDTAFHTLKALEMFAGTAVGALTFTGSVVAAGKLHDILPGRPIILSNRWTLNFGGLIASAALGANFLQPHIYASSAGSFCLLANTAIWAGLGANMVLPVGGADMPVIVSLLNALSGIATSAAGFMLSNSLLTITGALVASSGTLLSDIMCRGINRSMVNVLLGGFGTDGSSAAAVVAAAGGAVQEVAADGFVGMLLNARRVVIVPGYGLAMARCQQRLADIVALLRRHGVVVHFAIHPVAGRLPGHMNILLAEASVPYDIVHEMDEVNPEMQRYDVAVVVGANDIVNPATQDDPSSPIFGMPAIEVWRAKVVVVLKRSMATGYSGVDNPLFFKENVRMLFGDARPSLDAVFTGLDQSQGALRGASDSLGVAGSSEREQASETYPKANKVVGIIRERRPGDMRVSLSPSLVPKLRRMGFSVLLEAGAGVSAGFSDEEYVKGGGVQVAESALEVLQQADVVLKVNEPYLDEVQVLKSTQAVIGLWNMYGCEDLLKALQQSQATFVNITLVPRVSRAQKMDALTSMANIAGYKAVLDAFNRLPRFSRPSVTASGSVAAARVFVIGAGIAGLSAIATAHALGAKVLANDVREAAREQVEGMGAEFVPVDAQAISGEGVGGYATEMGIEFQERQLATYARVLPDVDIVVTTAMIPNRAAPVLITEAMVGTMKRGSVLVDLAAQAGGNCELSKKDQVVVTPGGVTILGETNYPSAMPGVASEMLGNNFAAMLETLGGAKGFGDEHWEDPVIRPAVVVRGGEVHWPPVPLPPTQPSQATVGGAAADAGSHAPAIVEPPIRPPEELQWLFAWIDEHKQDLMLALGLAVTAGLGLRYEVPETELMHIGYFALSLIIGHFTVASVTPALHTPLVSVTNAISGIIVVGGMLQLSGPLLSARVACALAAVFLSSINIVGGFAVTQRMLEMFSRDMR